MPGKLQANSDATQRNSNETGVVLSHSFRPRRRAVVCGTAPPRMVQPLRKERQTARIPDAAHVGTPLDRDCPLQKPSIFSRVSFPRDQRLNANFAAGAGTSLWLLPALLQN